MKSFHPAIKTTILYYAHSDLTVQAIAYKENVSKQAISKRIKKGTDFLLSYGQKNPVNDHIATKLKKMEDENKRQQDLIAHLRRQLIIKSTQIALLIWFKAMVNAFFPKLDLKRFDAYQKKHILDMSGKHLNANGLLKDFAKSINKSVSTLNEWKERYLKFGMAGLVDKVTRPKNFARKIPLWLKEQLIILFIRHPEWSDYQYYKYIRDNPSINYCLSIPTIKKIRTIHSQKSEYEKERLKKRWAFDEKYEIWNIDFTSIIKTDQYSLQLLTVSDQRSRFVFESALFLDTSTERLMLHLEDLFVKYGKPFLIKADNGPEMRLALREDLRRACIHLLNSPPRYAPFNGAHERIHRELKAYIERFSAHGDLVKLVEQVNNFTNDHNHIWTYSYLKNRTPAEVYYYDPTYVPEDVEVVKIYAKDGELRTKFTNRYGKPARMSIEKVDGVV